MRGSQIFSVINTVRAALTKKIIRQAITAIGCGWLPAASALTPFAVQIDHSNFSTVAVRGPHAIGGIGDWALGNGVLCATFTNAEHETYLSARGGVLVDLGHCGQADDLWNTAHALFNLSKDQLIAIDKVQAQHDANSAAIITSGEQHGIAMRTVYRVTAAEATTLHIDTTLTRQQKSPTRLFLFGLLGLHPNRSLAPFSLSLTAPVYNNGFAHPPLDTSQIRSVISAMAPSEWQVLVGSPASAPISYGWGVITAEHIDNKGHTLPLPLFAMNNQDITMFGVFTEPLLFARDKPGLLEFAQTVWMDLAVGESLHIEQQILLGERADVASITDRLYSGNALHGSIDISDNNNNSNVTIHIDDDHGAPLTAVVPNADGTFSARLPTGVDAIRLHISGAGIASTVQRFIIDAPDTDIGRLNIARPATLVLPRGEPMLLVFKGIDGAPDPVLFDDGKNFKVGARTYNQSLAANSVALAGIDADYRHIAILPGHYRVLATRGPFYTVTETTINAIGDAVVYLGIAAPQRAVNTVGWLSADFHVHSGYSFDSDLAPSQRLIQFAAQGADVFVAAEHNRIVDYAPLIDTLGLQHRIAAIGGSELTGLAHTPNAPRTMGHANVFPLSAQPNEFAGGALPHENRALGAVIGAYKKANPQLFFQLNHPRSSDRDPDMAYFNHLDSGKFAFDPSQTLSDSHNAALLKRRVDRYRDIDFDGMELLNGSSLDAYADVRGDWFALLHQGFIKIGTANSDSHATAQLVALPRNLVKFATADLAQLDTTGFIAAVKAGELVGTTGPFIDMTLNEAGLGDIFRGSQGTLTVHVDAAPWVAVDSLDIYVNGKRWWTVAIKAGETRQFAMTFNGPSFITAEVHGLPTAQYRDIAPGFTPLAFTNPIFVLPTK